MARNVFSVPIFFIVFRETLEAAIIVSVLLGLVEQIVHEDTSRAISLVSDDKDKDLSPDGTPVLTSEEDTAARNKRLFRKMRIQIAAGSGLGLFIALAIGAAFIAVWFTKASDLWAKSEELWEGVHFLPLVDALPRPMLTMFALS